MQKLFFYILFLTSAFNTNAQDIAYGRHSAIYIGLFHNGALKTEDYRTEKNKLNVYLTLNVSSANLLLNYPEGKRVISMEGASILKNELSSGNSVYSVYYDDNKKLSFQPYKENENIWFTTVIYWPNRLELGNYFKLTFPQKLVY